MLTMLLCVSLAAAPAPTPRSVSRAAGITLVAVGSLTSVATSAARNAQGFATPSPVLFSVGTGLVAAVPVIGPVVGFFSDLLRPIGFQGTALRLVTNIVALVTQAAGVVMALVGPSPDDLVRVTLAPLDAGGLAVLEWRL